MIGRMMFHAIALARMGRDLLYEIISDDNDFILLVQRDTIVFYLSELGTPLKSGVAFPYRKRA